jgi:hypothetical protein
MPDSPADLLTAATLMVTEYTANAVTPAARIADWWNWNVYARHTRAGRWVVTTGHEYYDANGQPHGTAHEAGDHSRADALDLAASVATGMRLMGETAVEASARITAARALLGQVTE